MNPTTEAIAFRIWSYANPREWNVTINDIADALEISRERVSRIVVVKRWNGRLRTGRIDADCLRNRFERASGAQDHAEAVAAFTAGMAGDDD